MKAITPAVSGIILAFLLSGLSVSAQTNEPSAQARDALNRGVSAFRSTHYDLAISLFKQAMEIDPDFTVAELYLAAAYSQLYIPGNPTRENLASADNAIESFRRVLAKDPGNKTALMGLARIYQNVNRYQDAREVFLAVAKSDPQDPAAFYSLGALDWIIVFDKKNPVPLAERSFFIDEGLANLDSALTLNPQYEDAMTYKNLLLRQKAELSSDPAEKVRLNALADEWFNKALDTRRRNAVAGPPNRSTEQRLLPPPPPPVAFQKNQ